MFFRSRRKQARRAEAAKDAPVLATEEVMGGDAVEGTLPEAAEVEPAPVDLHAAPDALPARPADAIRLFPGFEREDFEVGFSLGGRIGGTAPALALASAPALVMRWKDGGDWFRVPAMFNRSVLSAMDERDSAGDLSRLLRSFGYEVEDAA